MYLAIWSSGNPGAITISSSESNFLSGHKLLTQYRRVYSSVFDRLWLRNLWWIGCLAGREQCYAYVWLLCPWTQLHLTTAWSRCPLQHLRFSAVNIKSLHKLPKFRWGCCSCSDVCSRLNNCRNHGFGHPSHHISLMEVVSCVHPFRLGQFVKHHPLMTKTLHVVLYHVVDCAHHPAGFVIFTEHAKLWIFFIIILIFTILLIVWKCKIAQTDSIRSQHLLEWWFRLSGCRSYLFGIAHIFLQLYNRGLCIVNTLLCHSVLSIHIILDPCVFLFFGSTVRFSSFLRRNLLFRSQAAQSTRFQDHFYLKAALAFTCIMTWLLGALRRCDVCARQE